MKNGIKGYIAGVLTCVMLFGIVFASYGQIREIFFGVRVSVNGEIQNFDEDMTPFIMDGRTFLPVRGIADSLGVDVDFDAYNNIVLLNQNITVDDLLAMSDEAIMELVSELFELISDEFGIEIDFLELFDLFFDIVFGDMY